MYLTPFLVLGFWADFWFLLVSLSVHVGDWKEHQVAPLVASRRADNQALAAGCRAVTARCAENHHMTLPLASARSLTRSPRPIAGCP